VRPSSTPWASSVVLAKRPGGTVRTCFGARRLNSVTKKDSFTLPRLKGLLRRFKGAKYFSVPGAASGFHGVPLPEESVEKTTFITRFGLHECTRMPFGLVNSPATYQRLVSLTL